MLKPTRLTSHCNTAPNDQLTSTALKLVKMAPSLFEGCVTPRSNKTNISFLIVYSVFNKFCRTKWFLFLVNRRVIFSSSCSHSQPAFARSVRFLLQTTLFSLVSGLWRLLEIVKKKKVCFLTSEMFQIIPLICDIFKSLKGQSLTIVLH